MSFDHKLVDHTEACILAALEANIKTGKTEWGKDEARLLVICIQTIIRI